LGGDLHSLKGKGGENLFERVVTEDRGFIHLLWYDEKVAVLYEKKKEGEEGGKHIFFGFDEGGSKTDRADDRRTEGENSAVSPEERLRQLPALDRGRRSPGVERGAAFHSEKSRELELL